MPKLLHLMRHAQSAEKQPGQADKDRELTSTGVKEALQIGSYFYREKILLDVIYSSIAIRSTATAQYISDAMKLDIDKLLQDEELFQASVRTFLEFVNRLDDHYNNILCIGHNPTVSYLAEYLTKAEIGDMVTAGVVTIKFDSPTWKDIGEATGEFIEYIEPSMLTND